MLDESYWSERYQSGQIGWDVGAITTPLKEYFDQLQDKSLSILIPGAGNAYEAEYLHQNGFDQVFVCDVSREPLEKFIRRNPGFNGSHLLYQNFFDLKDSYDLIVEQTFFCAIDRRLRSHYAQKAHELLKPSGKLVGLLWKFDEFQEGPPFGGSQSEYLKIFEPYFEIAIMEECYNSIRPRSGRELFIKLIKQGD